MTNCKQDAAEAIMDTYTPLDVKDIITEGASKCARYHVTRDEVLGFYADHNDGVHHELLDSDPRTFAMYQFFQACYNESSKSHTDQWYYIRDVVWLYIDTIAAQLAEQHDLYDTPRKVIEDEVLRIDLERRKADLQIIDGGKS